MIAGHFGFAAMVKSRETAVPLWALMLATVWLDVVFVPLFVAGVETIDSSPGGGYGGNIIHADYTHSLLGALLLSALWGAAFYWRLGLRSACVLGCVAFSHWLLDLPVHRADMPLLPGNMGNLPMLGFGLWQYRGVVVVLELALVVLGAWLYWRAARAITEPAQPLRRRALVTTILMLLGGVGVLLMDVTGA
jgi:membrane-bound metal-dependent hydrolase YbcI (DUF457 family)